MNGLEGKWSTTRGWAGEEAGERGRGRAVDHYQKLSTDQKILLSSLYIYRS